MLRIILGIRTLKITVCTVLEGSPLPISSANTVEIGMEYLPMHKAARKQNTRSTTERIMT